MRPITTKMPTLFRRAFFTLIGISLITGIAFFVMNNWISIEGDFGPEKHPWQFPAIKIHGASAFILMMLYGSLLMSHVPFAWKTRRLRNLGIALVSVIGFQVISAWFLYYLANENIRLVITYLHLSVGCSIPLVLTAHIWVGHNARKNLKRQRGIDKNGG